MKIFFISMLFCSQALAYSDGIYHCKNSDTAFPDNEYKIETVSVGSARLPYLEIKRYFRKELHDPNSAIVMSTVKGFATVGQIEDSEILSVSSIHLEFVNDQLINCKK